MSHVSYDGGRMSTTELLASAHGRFVATSFPSTEIWNLYLYSEW